MEKQIALKSKNNKISISNGIIFIDVVPKAAIDLEETEALVHDIKMLSAGTKRPVLADIRKVTNLSSDSRSYLKQLDFLQEHICASAIVVHSPASKLIGSLFLGFLRPPYPIELFSNFDKAKKWCKRFI